MKEYADNMCWL